MALVSLARLQPFHIFQLWQFGAHEGHFLSERFKLHSNFFVQAVDLLQLDLPLLQFLLQ